MDHETDSVRIFFFPFVGGGHQIPMIDTARVFAKHGAISTILTTPSNALQFKNSITRDQKSNLPITIHTLTEITDTDTDMSAGPMIDTSVLLEPLKQFLLQHKPDCIVVDMFHRWAGDIIDDLKIPRIVFTGNGCFPRCVIENTRKHVVFDNLSSDYEPFLVPGLPDRIEMTKSQVPIFMRNTSQIPDRIKQLDEKSFGTVINSFYDFEPAYADYTRNVLGIKAWLVGPVSLCNRSVEDKKERGKQPTMDEQSCLNWLNSKKPNSVLYVSFGSLARLHTKQIKEIAYGLEASDQSFIWVVGKILNSTDKEETCGENWVLDEFEKRMKELDKGLIFRGWAPQLLILEHDAVGGFMTHCGWNSTLEGVCVGVPMITWPLSAEQFINEKLVTDVLKIGVQVGSKEWGTWDRERKELVGREKVEFAVKKLMRKSEETEEMRRRVKQIAENAKSAVEEGGTSYADIDAFIQELKACRFTSQV
ncbi:abscisate beta-glucosyltransferase-like [Cicer arietinum]|uniref:Glycosyltransferase n=1 Tax=Cicer arietinum TaxID=3827 RepID=A0A067XT81_CICAR|nr:abscisate beta-glucosyltransferase [Cicer arietinum]AGU14083.1 UDP-glycosyltransferase [Cicer arietinum]